MMVNTRPALWVVHEEQVEQPVASVGQPDEFILQVIVGLFPQTVLTNEGQLRETLEHTHTPVLTRRRLTPKC